MGSLDTDGTLNQACAGTLDTGGTDDCALVESVSFIDPEVLVENISESVTVVVT